MGANRFPCLENLCRSPTNLLKRPCAQNITEIVSAILMENEYHKQHYVPVWYQKRFMPPAAKDNELLYLDLRPGTFKDPRGVVHPNRALRRLGPKRCFYEPDLYTHTMGNIRHTEIEQYFFGAIDGHGKKAIEHFTDFDHMKAGTHEALQPMLLYMSTQKLRTPKGLGWLAEKTRNSNHSSVLETMVRLQQIFCAIWTESIWLIADASQSKTKLLVSDNPVTVYNRRCGPQWCNRHNDPDIWLNGTHTFFPLSAEKLLILTNLSWVRNPYQDPITPRPNPNPFRHAMFNILDIQIGRHLIEQEVREINFITKLRAHRYIAAAQEDWLYPERYISKSDWSRYGHGYLFMPDPRSVTFSGETLISYENGRAEAFDEYGRRPWQQDYGKPAQKSPNEWKTFHRFQGEFARLFGPYRRGRSNQMDRLDNERDSDDYHQYHLSLETPKIRKSRGDR